MVGTHHGNVCNKLGAHAHDMNRSLKNMVYETEHYSVPGDILSAWGRLTYSVLTNPRKYTYIFIITNAQRHRVQWVVRVIQLVNGAEIWSRKPTLHLNTILNTNTHMHNRVCSIPPTCPLISSSQSISALPWSLCIPGNDNSSFQFSPDSRKFCWKIGGVEEGEPGCSPCFLWHLP